MNNTDIIQIRKKSGLEKVVVSKNGAVLSPKEYSQDTMNPRYDGEYEGDYKGKTFYNTKQFISPTWDEMESKWCWAGSPEELSAIIEQMKLRYPKGHEKEGTIIPPGNPHERLTNIKDPVFNHPDLFSYYMEMGRVSLRLSDPKQKFLAYCLKGNPAMEDLSEPDTTPVSKYIKSGINYEIVSPSKENEKKKNTAKKEIEAVTVLGGMEGDEDKIRAICEIMELPGYGHNTDINAAFVLLKDQAAQNTTYQSKYGTTYQNRFLELANMPTGELEVMHKIVRAKSMGLVRIMNGYAMFDGEKIEGIHNLKTLIKFFKDPGNQDFYIKLVDILENGYSEQ